MELLGYKNVIHIPNFKKIAYIPEKSTEISAPFRFVFLSRIIPEKVATSSWMQQENKPRNR